MLKLLCEKIYDINTTRQDLKLKKMSEYMGSIPNNGKVFVKMLAFAGQDANIYNITDIAVSKTLVDGTAELTDDPKIVRIIYSRNELNACTCKHFKELCAKILEALKDVDPEQTILETSTRADKKGGRFRFYYDTDYNCAFIVKAANTETIQNFIKAHSEEFAKIAKTKKTQKMKVDPKKDAEAAEKVEAKDTEKNPEELKADEPKEDAK